MGKVFFGESMFSLVSNASKIAFVYLVQNMDYELIDCQVENAHLKSLGAFNIERNVFFQYRCENTHTVASRKLSLNLLWQQIQRAVFDFCKKIPSVFYAICVTTDVVDEDLTFSNSPVLPQAESPIMTKVNAINLIIFFILSSLI
jgi:hypothetical protein